MLHLIWGSAPITVTQVNLLIILKKELLTYIKRVLAVTSFEPKVSGACEPYLLARINVGRTQPSLTRSVEGEVEKLLRVARKLRDESLAEALKDALADIRLIEEAFEDELADPLEVLLVALLARCSRRVPG